MKSYEELRQSMISNVASLNFEMGLSDLNAEEEVDEFITAIRMDERAKIRDRAHPLMVGLNGEVEVWTVNSDALCVPDITLDNQRK